MMKRRKTVIHSLPKSFLFFREMAVPERIWSILRFLRYICLLIADVVVYKHSD